MTSRLLLVWLSPSFPVGAYAYSHGLEAAVASGLVTSRRTLEDWLDALITHGSVRNDLILAAASWRAEDAEVIGEVNALALALQPSAERYLETSQQGGSFVAAIVAAWPTARVDVLRAACPDAIAYPAAIGVAAGGHGVPLGDMLEAYALAVTQALVSAAIRLSVIGQTDGQRVVAHLMPAMSGAARAAKTSNFDDLGGACFSSDLASMEHETLATRLFRS